MAANAFSILVGTDFSDSSDRALLQALQLAEQIGARLELVHVCQIQAPAVPEAMLAMSIDSSHIAEARKTLRALKERMRGYKVPCHTHLRIGDPVGELLEVIEILRPQLVVVGSHGRGAVMRALLGSVSERLCRRSPVPVLVVPAPERGGLAREAASEEHPRHPAVEMAWSCTHCGHIRGESESPDRCARCGAQPATWDSAPISHRPADELEPAVGESPDEHISSSRANDPAGLFPTSPPGTEGYSVNPELRVRY